MPITSKINELLKQKRIEGKTRELSSEETNKIREKINSTMKIVRRKAIIQQHKARLELRKVVLTD